MHDDLLAVASRRGILWCLVAAALLAAAPGAVVSVAAGVGPGVATFAALAFGQAAWLLAGAPGGRQLPWPRDRMRPAEPVVHHVAEGIALANGEPTPTAVQVAATPPNVAAFEGRGGEPDVLVVSDGALKTLPRDELEAVCALQLAIAHDPTCRRLEDAAGALVLFRVVGFVVFVPAVFLASAAPGLGLSLLAIVAGMEAAGWLVGARLRWWARVAGDAVAVRTTRHPEPLTRGLRRLARWNGSQVPIHIGATLAGTGATRWAVPIGAPWESTTRDNGRVDDVRSRELVEDTKLLVRAGLVRRVCLEGADATLASWREVADTVRLAGRAAAIGGTAVIEGERVGLHGTVDDATS